MTGSLAGLLLVDKEQGITSAGVTRRVKRIAGGARVGHAGSLDPFATGLLPVCLGPATRLVRFVAAGAKQYEATVRFGWATDTDDCTGVPLGEPAPLPTAEDIRRALPGFLGEILQTPPRYSAKRVAGKRAYRMARAGKEVPLAPVPVRIRSVRLLDYDGRDARICCETGPGVYIRALARDIRARLGGAAHLVSLRRLMVGPHRVEDSVKSESLRGREDLAKVLLPALRVFDGWEHLEVSLEEARRLGHGMSIPDSGSAIANGQRVAVLHRAGSPRFVAVVEATDSRWRPIVVWPEPPLW